jgi:hypothetical protein
VISRSSLEFCRRLGLEPTPRLCSPVFDGGALPLHTIPLLRDQMDPRQCLDAAGEPPPDRGITDRWPPAQEVQIGGQTQRLSE